MALRNIDRGVLGLGAGPISSLADRFGINTILPDELLRSLRSQYLIDLIKPYTRLELSFLAKVSA